LIWLPLALISAISWATADYLTKKWYSSLTPLEMAFWRHFWCLPFLWPFFLLAPSSFSSLEFWEGILKLLPVEILATFLYAASIRASPLSLSLPFLSFTPLFMTLTGAFLLGERPSEWGLGGIGLVSFGGYLLGWEGSFLSSFKVIRRERGAYLMMIVAGLYAWTSVMGKKVLLVSHPFYFGPIYVSLMVLFLGIPLFIRPLRIPPLKKGLLIGAFMAIMFLCHWSSILMVQASYMIAVKRTSPLFGVLYGGLFLKEEGFKRRLFATSLMVLGVVMITVLG